MADKLYKKLPGVLQTGAIKNFFESTVEQLFSQANVEVINGYIGKQPSQDFDVKGVYLREETATRHHYGLSPAVNTLNANTNTSENIIFYDEFLDTLKVSGASTKDHNRLFNTNFSSFLPPIDIDKFINYQEYYWSFDGLPATIVSGTLENPIDIDRDILGKKSYTAPNGVTLKSGMRVIFEGAYVIPDTKISSEYFVEGVGESIRLVDVNQNIETPFSTATLTAWDSTAFTSNDSNVSYTAGNILSVSVLNGGNGYTNPTITFTGANTTPATASANADGNGTITDVTVVTNGLNYSSPIGINISSDIVTANVDTANTFVTFLNTNITSQAPYSKIALDDITGITVGHEFTLNNEIRNVTSINSDSIVSIENITNQFDANRTPGSYSVSGSGGSGTDAVFKIDVIGPESEGIVEVGNITLSNATLSGTYPVDFTSANSYIVGNISTSGGGANAYLSVTLDGSGGANVYISDGGDGFLEGDTITINDNILGGDGTGNLQIEVLDVVTVGDTFISLVNGGINYAVGDTITVSDSDLGNGGANDLTFDIARVGGVIGLSEFITLDSSSNTLCDFYGVGFEASIRTSMYTLTANTEGTFITGLSSMALSGVDPVTGDFYLSGAPDAGENYGWDVDTDSSQPGGDPEGDIPWGGRTTQDNPDYNVLSRGSVNRNVWSRVNFWHHKDNFKDAGIDLPSAEYRAKRPILEFDHRLEMFNMGNSFAGTVNIVSREYNKDEVDGSSTTLLIDATPASIGSTIIFPNDATHSKYIYKVSHVSGNISLSKFGDPSTNPADTEEGEVGFVPFEFSEGKQINIKSGAFGRGKEYFWKDGKLVLTQVKEKINQAPLFNIYNDQGNFVGDINLYKSNNFDGNKIFNYKVGTGTNDAILQFPVSYKAFTTASEIEFENYLETDRTSYIPFGSTSQTEILGYYYYKLSDTKDIYHNLWKSSEAKSEQNIKTFYYINTFDLEVASTRYYIGCEPRIDSSKSSGYNIEILVNNTVVTNYSYIGSGLIEFTEFNFSAGDIIEITAYSDTGLISERSISKYSLPINWSNNTENVDILNISEPEYLSHFGNFLQNQDGFTGDKFNSNNFKDTAKNSKFALDIVKTDEDLRLGAFLLDDQPHNLLEAIRFSEREYVRYKNRLRSETTKYFNSFDTSLFTKEYILDKILRNVLSLNIGNDSFQQTYIVPFGDNFIEENKIINIISERSHTMSAYEDLDKIENALLVYHIKGNTQTLLEVEKDYVFDSYNPITVRILDDFDLDLGDTIKFILYNKERDSAQCPPTPSTMGIYPLTVPVIETDYSFKEPTQVLVGHDGSRSALFGDDRDDIILEFEKRIYNSAKKEFREANSLPELNVFNVRAGAFRNTNFANNEWFDLMRSNFANWTIDNNVDPVINETYNLSDEWSWNYRGTKDIPGYWKGWYIYYYDTVRPHTHPWEMLGFTEKPLWWNDEYGTDYTPTNSALWNDLELGIIRRGPRANFVDGSYLDLPNNPCARIGLHEVLPVDSSGNLISPYDIVSTGSTTKSKEWTNAFVSDTFPANTFVNANSELYDGVSISSDSSNIYIKSNALVNHSTNVVISNVGHSEIEPQQITFNFANLSLSALSIISANATTMPSKAIAILVNGLPLFNPQEENSWNNGNVWHYNAVEVAHSDLDYGHTTANGLMHYHTIKPQIIGLSEWSTTEHSPIVGWAFDGLPIYGPYGYAEYNSSGTIVNNSITPIKSCFSLRTGERKSSPKGDHTGYFVEDYKYDSSLEGISGYTGSTKSGAIGKYNLRYGVTPESPSTPIHFYVATIDDNGKPMFPYAVGGGTKTHTSSGVVYANKYFYTGQDLSNNTLASGYVNSSATAKVKSLSVIDQAYTDDIDNVWRFGDGSPVENAWRYSESYPFAVAEALLLAKPGKFATVFGDPTRITKAPIDKKKIIDKTSRRSWNFKNSTNFVIHGTYDVNGNFNTNIGYSQFIKSYLSFQGLNIQTDFADKLKTLNSKLSHRMSGFIDKDTATIRTDQFSTTGSSKSLVIPSENIDVTVHKSPYKTRNSYSGVIIEKTTGGYKVKGYDKNFAYFTVLESNKNGDRQSIERGGDPAPFTNWASNKTFELNTIVKYQNSYYQAKNRVFASSTFDKTQWTRLPSLPQVGAAKGIFYKETTGIEKRVDYETEYSNVVDLFDFLVSLGRYQKTLGFSFGLYDPDINDVRDWSYAAEQFLFWTTGKWEIGNTLELSPMATKITFEKAKEFVSEIKRTDKNQFTLLDQDGVSISPKDCEIIRENNRVEIVPPEGRQIYSAILFTEQIEHVLIFDNITEFNDTIYNSLLNQRQDRISVKAKRTLGWEGRLSSEGYIIDEDELQPNLDNFTSTMSNYHTLGFIPVDKDLYTISRGLFGFEKRDYLTDLGILDDSQFEFYKGMLSNKGTAASISRIGNSNAIIQGNISVFDEWALRVGEFGDVDNEQSLELKIDKHEIVQDPQLFKLEFPEDVTGVVKSVVVTENNHKYFSVPTIEISAPTKDPKKQATAKVNLKDGLINSVTVTEQGSGYESQNAVAKVLAGNVNVSDTSTTFNVVIAQSSALLSNANVVGIADISIADHFASNVLAQTIDLSSATTVADVVTAINSNSVTNANIVASSVESFDANSNTNFYVLQITGNDFTLGGSGLANLNISADRYQPKQRYAIDIAGNTSAGTGATVKSDISVYVDGSIISNTNFDYDAGDRWKFITSSIVTSGSFSQHLISNGLENSSNVFATENTVQVNGNYPYIDVYYNNTKLKNTSSATQYTVANTTAITFPDVTKLPGGKLDTNANVYVVERATIDFVDAYQGDIPGKTLQIKVQTNDGIAITYDEKKLRTITPDIQNDEIITIDIDDNTRFLKKPTGARNNKLWPTTNKVDYTGLTDPDYRTLPNAGYVLRPTVDYQAYGVMDLQDLFAIDRIYKPSKNNLIHIASSENKDWNVYKLREPANSLITFVEQESIDDTAYLYSTVNLFNYIDSNQLQQNDLSRYLDYTLVIKKANISDNVVIWTNQEIVDKKAATVKNFGAVSMLQANVANVTPVDTYEITNIQPYFSQNADATITRADANAVVTVKYDKGSPKNGDQITILDYDVDVQTYGASAIGHLDTGNYLPDHDSYIQVTTTPANVANIVANFTPVRLNFTGGNIVTANVANITPSSVTDVVYFASNVDYANGTFQIYSDSTDFQDYFGNVANATISAVTTALTNISFEIDVRSNIHNKTYSISNVNRTTNTFTVLDNNVTANVSTAVIEYQNRCELTVLPIIGNTTTYTHDLVAGDVIKVFSNNIRGYYNIQSATDETIVINAPYHANISTTGKLVTRGVDIQTSEPHNLDKKYAGKRVMIHNAENKYYNQLYRVNNVRNNTTIRNAEIFAYEPGTTSFANAILTTLDHDVVKLNNTSIKIDNTTSVAAVADSINRTQAIKRGFTRSDTYGISLPMMTTGISDLGWNFNDFAGRIPYVTQFTNKTIKNLTITGGLPVGKMGEPGYTKDNVKLVRQDGSGNTPIGFVEPGASNLPYNEQTEQPINTATDPYVNVTNTGEPTQTVTEVPTVTVNSDGASNLKGTDKNPKLGNRQSVVLTGSVMDQAPKRKCGPECSTTRFRGTRRKDVKNPTICYDGRNLTNFTVSGTGHGARRWESEYSGYYTPQSKSGGGHGNIGLKKLGIMGAKTWSDNGSTQTFSMTFKTKDEGPLYVHCYQMGRADGFDGRGRDTTTISISGTGVTATPTSLRAIHIGKDGPASQPAVSDSVIRLDFEAGATITINGTCLGATNHWHGLEMHVSAQEDVFDKCGLPKTDNSDDEEGTANPPRSGERTAYAYKEKEKNQLFDEEFFFETTHGGLGTLLFDNYGGADGIQIWQGKQKQGLMRMLTESTAGNLRRLTEEERNVLKNQKEWETRGQYVSKNIGVRPFQAGHKPQSDQSNENIGVKYAGALDFDIDGEEGKVIRILIKKASNIFSHVLLLPTTDPTIENPGVDPNPVIPCGEISSIPPDANSNVTASSLGSDTAIFTPSGEPVTKAQSGGNRNTTGGKSINTKLNGGNFAGFGRPYMTGFSFIPSIFRKSVKLTYSPNYGVPISLTSGRYVNNNIQKISGGFVVPLAKRLTNNIPLDSAPLRSLDSRELPFYNILDANQSAFEKGGIFYNFDPKRINSDIKLSDGTFIRVTPDGELIGLNLGDTFNYDNPYDGGNPFGPGVGDEPVTTQPAEGVAEGPVDTTANFNQNVVLMLTPLDDNNNEAGPTVPVPVFRPTPGHTINLNGVNLNPEDDFFINGTRIAPKGSSQEAIIKAINCTNVVGFEAKPIGKDKVRISSCTNAPLAVKEGCSGGAYKEVLDFHIVRSFTDSEVSNTSVLASPTSLANASPQTNYEFLDVDGGVIGNIDVTSGLTGQGYVLSSKSVTTGGNGYTVGDRLRLIGGTPISDPFAGIKEICVSYAGAGYSAPENIVVNIGDGTTPGRDATVKTVIFDKNNGIKKVILDNPGNEYDANRPPVVTIVDTGDQVAPQVWSANTSYTRNDLIQHNIKGVASVTNISAADPDRTAGTYDIDLYDYSELGGRKAEFRIVIDDTGAATVEILAPGVNFPQVPAGTFTIPAGEVGGGSSDLTFDLDTVVTVDTKYYQVHTDFTSGAKFDRRYLRPRNKFLSPVSAKLEAIVAENGRIPRVAKFEVTSTDYLGGITSLKILDRGIYKIFPSDLTNGLPIEYDHINLGDESGIDENGNFTQGSGLGQFDPKTLVALESPGAYDPIIGLAGGGSGAKVFLTSREIPDCSQKGGMKDALGLPDLINDLNPLDDLASFIQGGLGDYGYDPDDWNVDTQEINDDIGRININMPGFGGLNIDELTPGFLTKLGIPPGDYNLASLCIQAVVETAEQDDNPEVINKLTALADNLGLGLSTEGPIEVLKLICVDTVGKGPRKTPGGNLAGTDLTIPGSGNGQDGNSIFGDGTVTFAKDLYQYELRTLAGRPVNLNSGSMSQEAQVLYMESQRYDTDTAITSANNPYISNVVANFGNVWIDDYNGNGWAYLENNVVISAQEDLVDPKFIKNTIIYDSETGIKKFNLEPWDPFKGVLPGFIDKEIDFIGENDPVVYTSSRTKFDDKFIGKTWWDTSTIRYNWYEQGTNRQRWLNWGSAFPGSTISLYEWVKSDVPPTSFTGEGTPRTTDGFITKQERDPITDKYRTVYYYWVRNLKTLSNEVTDRLGRRYDTYTLATYLSDPINYGLNLMSFISNNSFVASNLSQMIADEGDHLQINFSRNLNPDGKKHVSWTLAREGDNNTAIPEDHSRKLIDSICEQDAIGNVVPDPALSEVQKYGIGFRPRQTMFKDVKEARRELIGFLNTLFKSLKMNTEFENWDSKLPTQRTYIETKDWYELKSNNPVSGENIYFDETFKPIYKVNSKAELNTLNDIIDGSVIQVQGNSSERAKLYIYDGLSKTFGLIAIKDEIIQIKDTAYTDDANSILQSELRLLLETIKSNVFKDRNIWNQVYFTMLRYAIVEQPQIDWAFKTSYVYIEKDEIDLIKYKGFKPDNFDSVVEYMNEAKPYSTKVREFKDGKSAPIEFIKDQMISDFDKPPYVDFVNGVVRILDENVSDDANILSSDSQYTKYNSISNKSNSPIRQGNTTIVFDRTNWKPTQFNWNPSIESANLSIAKNLSWLSSSSNTMVSSNVNVRSVDRIFKFDSAVQTEFTNSMKLYLTSEQGYTSNQASNVSLIGSQGNIEDALDKGYLKDTLSLLKTKVGGDFKGEMLDANLFTKVVPGYDPTTDFQTTFAYDTMTYDTDGIDISTDVVNYSGAFDESLVNFRRFDTTYQGFDGVTFKKMLYGEERPEELVLFDPLENFIITVTTNAYELGNISANLITANANTVVYRTHQDMFGSTEFIRVSLANATTLTANAIVSNDTITVADASVLPKPLENTPGVIWIESERIEYKVRNTITNILSELTRGTRGTTAQDWIITDESGASITRNVYDGSENQTFTDLVQEPEKSVWLDTNAVSLADYNNANANVVTSIMKFLHNK